MRRLRCYNGDASNISVVLCRIASRLVCVNKALFENMFQVIAPFSLLTWLPTVGTVLFVLFVHQLLNPQCWSCNLCLKYNITLICTCISIISINARHVGCCHVACVSYFCMGSKLTLTFWDNMRLHGWCGLGAIIWIKSEKETERDYHYWG